MLSQTLWKKDMSSFGLRTNLTAFVSTPYQSGLVMGMGGYLVCRRAAGSREGCLHQGSRKSGVLAEAELGRGRKERRVVHKSRNCHLSSLLCC